MNATTETMTGVQTSVAASWLRRYWPWLLYAAALTLVPFIFESGYTFSILNQMGIAIIFALAYNMLLGQGGMLSFGHAVYMGLGGYACIHFINMIGNDSLNIPVPFVPFFGGLAGLFFGLLFGRFSTRKAGTIFAMISLGVAELVASSSHIVRGFFGGEEGVDTDRMVGPVIFGLDMAADTDVYVVIAFWAFISTILMYLITHTPLGRMSNAVRDNPERVQFLGYNPQNVRYLVFALSGFFAGIAGGLTAINYEILTAESVSTHASGTVLLMAFIGGIGHFFGPIIGAIFITLLAVGLSSITEAWQLYLGLIFILMVLFAPFGIAGIIMQHEPLWKMGKMKRLYKPYLHALIPAFFMILGVITLIEINFHLRLRGFEGPTMNLFGITIDASSNWVWGLAILFTIGGFIYMKRAFPDISDTWSTIVHEIQQAGASK